MPHPSRPFRAAMLKAELSAQAFSDALALVARAAAPTSVVEALTGILMEVQDNGLRLTATNMEMGLEVTVPAHAVLPGRIVVVARHLADFVRRLPDVLVTLEEVEGNRLVLRWGQSSYELPGIPGDAFQRPRFDVEGAEWTCSSGQLSRAVRQVAYAAAQKDSRPILTGIQWRFSGSEVEFVATDNFRLAWSRLAATSAPQELTVVVPAVNLVECARIMDASSAVRVQMNDRQVSFTGDGVKAMSRILDGAFPDYRRALPQQYVTRVTAPAPSLLGLIERAVVVADLSKQPVMNVSIAGGRVRVTAGSVETGRVDDQVSDAEVEGADLDLAFQPRFVLEGVRGAGGDPVLMEFAGSNSPLRVRSGAGDDAWALLLPLRTGAA